MEPAAITAYLARLGTNKDAAPLPMEELISAFSLSDFGRSPPRFDARQLLMLNRKFLHALEFDAVRDRLPEGADTAFWSAIRGNLDLLNEARRWWEVVHGEFTPPDLKGDEAVLKAALETLPPAPFGPESWKTWTTADRRRHRRERPRAVPSAAPGTDRRGPGAGNGRPAPAHWL